MENIEIPIPDFSSYNSKILNTHIMYGLVESLLRGGVRDVRVFPRGEGYKIQADFTWPQLLEGMKSALQHMLALHFATGHGVEIKMKSTKLRTILSDVSFCGGVFLDPPQNIQRYPRELQAILRYLERANPYSETEKILEEMKSSKSFIPDGRSKHLVVLEQLDPTISKWIGFYSYEEGGRLSRLEYALAWIGLHYYSTISKILRKSNQRVIIAQYPPLERIKTWELLLIKDIATGIVDDKEEYWRIGVEYGLFRKLLDVSLPPSVEGVPGLSTFGMVLYAQERSGAKGWRIFRQLELPRLWDFVSHLKMVALYDLVKFVRTLKGLECSKDNKKAIDDVLAQFGRGIYSAIVFNEVNDLYVAIRGLRRLGYTVPHKVMNAIIEYVLGDRA